MISNYGDDFNKCNYNYMIGEVTVKTGPIWETFFSSAGYSHPDRKIRAQEREIPFVIYARNFRLFCLKYKTNLLLLLVVRRRHFIVHQLKHKIHSSVRGQKLYPGPKLRIKYPRLSTDLNHLKNVRGLA